MSLPAKTIVACLFIGSLSGCTSTGDAPAVPRICKNITLVSRNGGDFYTRARTQYAEIRAADLRGPALDAQMTQVLRQLDGAITNDPRAMLFHSKLADMYAESGQADKAQSHYETARKLCDDWVPAWIGLAHLATQNGAHDDARSYLNSAKVALERVQGTAAPKQKEPDFFAILGINIPPDPTPGKSPDDPTLGDDAALRQIVNHLQESEAWTIENPALLEKGLSGASVVQSAGLFRRLRARIEYENALIRLSEKAPPAEMLKALDYSLQWDPDFFPAKIETAVQLRAGGNYQEAERILRPYVDSSDAKLSNNGRLLFEMASIYTDWFKQSKDAEISDLAEKYFARLYQVNPQHAEGFLKRAEHYLNAGTHFKRADMFTTGIACLDEAKKLNGGKDTAAITGLRGQFAKAQAAP